MTPDGIMIGGFAEQEPAGRHLTGNHRIFESDDLDQTRDHIARTHCLHNFSVNDRSGRLGAWLNDKRLSQVSVGAMTYGELLPETLRSHA